MMERTLRSLDSGFRGAGPEDEDGGIEGLRRNEGGETDRGGVEEGEWTSAHCELDSGKPPPLVGGHKTPAAAEVNPGSGSRSGVERKGLGDGDGMFMMDKGGRMLKIWSSAGGGP
jgi:hypothetical protein